MIVPSTVVPAPAATCTLQLLIVLEIVLLVAVIVYPLVAGVIVMVALAGSDSEKLLAVLSCASVPYV